MIFTAAWVSACTIIVYCAFCRLVSLGEGALAVVRLAFWLLGCAAGAGVFAVFAWEYVPDWPDSLLALCMALVQVATSRLWASGVPTAYLKKGSGTRRRVTDVIVP